jgi:superfamily II DNA or RNA helicase
MAHRTEASTGSEGSYTDIEDALYHRLLRKDLPDWYRQEVLAAIALKTVLWSDLSPEFKDLHGLPSRDMGIDCANETLAVQVKHRPISKRVNWGEISRFITAAKIGPNPFATAILLVDRDVRVCPIRKELYERKYLSDITKNRILGEVEQKRSSPPAETNSDAEKPSHLEVRSTVDAFPTLEKPISSEVSPMEVVVEPKDILVLRGYQLDILKEIESGEASSISIPCGSGKSYIMAGYASKHREEKIIIFVPSILLLEQMCDLLAKFAIPSQAIGTGHTDSIEKIASESNVRVCVYNSAHKIKDDSFNMIFVDEAHHVHVPEVYISEDNIARDESDTSFNAILPTIKTKRIVYFSATLDDADYKMDLRKMIEERYLSDYDIHIPCYSRPIDNEQIVFLLERHIEYSHVLLYSNRCDRAKTVSDVLNEKGIACGYFDAYTPTKERLRILETFKRGEIRCLSTVNTLGEGVDIKIADTCIFVEHRGSRISTVQCVGRILRRHPEKVMAHVVLPACDDEEASVQHLMRAIIGEDSLVGSSISKKGCRTFSSVGPLQSRNPMEKESEVSKQETPSDNDDKEGNLNCALLGEGLYTSLGKCLTGVWEVNYQRLLRYVAAEGKVPTRGCVFEGACLGLWVDKQRQGFVGRRYINPERIAKLDSVPGWFWERDLDAQWNKTYEVVERYCRQNGTIPTQHTTFEGVGIGVWVTHQRSQYRGAIASKLTPTRIHLLEQLPGWIWDQKLEDQWMKKYNILLRYAKANGRLPGSGNRIEGEDIGRWITNLKKSYVGELRCKLTLDRCELLEAVPGWTWEKKR